MDPTVLAFVLFNVFVLAMLALDLGVFRRKSHTVSFREALCWVGVWVSLSLTFCVGIYIVEGRDLALKFLAGYLVEQSLSMDNLFVFLMLFTYFRLPAEFQHKVLFWGIIGALVMRAFFIAAGITLIHRFDWILYVFGVFLVFTGIKMALAKDKEIHPERNPVLRLLRRYLPVTPDYVGDRFFIRIDARLFATPMFVVLVMVETTDLVFAVDSIPAVLAITRDPFIVYTSNVFAILGLRSLFFALSGLMRYFHHLHYGLSLILVFVGCKMLYAEYTGRHVPVELTLGVIGGVLALSIAASLAWPHERERTAPM